MDGDGRSGRLAADSLAGDFSHPEALVHVDGVPLAACDRHHQEIVVPDRYCDGAAHQLVLPGWIGGVPEVMGPAEPSRRS